MLNIDRIRKMDEKELIVFINSDKCNRCSYKDMKCGNEMCSVGIKEYLNQECELTIHDIEDDYYKFCRESFNLCEYNSSRCKLLFLIDNFNIIDGKITRR